MKSSKAVWVMCLQIGLHSVAKSMFPKASALRAGGGTSPFRTHPLLVIHAHFRSTFIIFEPPLFPTWLRAWATVHQDFVEIAGITWRHNIVARLYVVLVAQLRRLDRQLVHVRLMAEGCGPSRAKCGSFRWWCTYVHDSLTLAGSTWDALTIIAFMLLMMYSEYSSLVLRLYCDCSVEAGSLTRFEAGSTVLPV